MGVPLHKEVEPQRCPKAKPQLSSDVESMWRSMKTTMMTKSCGSVRRKTCTSRNRPCVPCRDDVSGAFLREASRRSLGPTYCVRWSLLLSFFPVLHVAAVFHCVALV